MSLTHLFEMLSWRDAVDVLAVSILVYNMVLLIRGTRAVQILFGILVLAAVSYLARVFELKTLEALLNAFFLILPFAVIVLFQSQIRRALASVGQNPLLMGFTQREVASGFVNELVHTATTLSKRRVGALIVIERHEGLRDYAENGIALDALISVDLLLTVFQPGTPLHDGALILSGGRATAAACFLPLSSNAELSTRYGTRHRAALGIVDETDALAVVVSEETGRISLALRGELLERLTSDQLRQLLNEELDADAEHEKAA